MHIQINLTEEIINDCLRIHFKNNPFGKRQVKKLIWIPVILIVISIYLIYTEFKQPQLWQNFYLALLYVAFAFGYYFFMKKRMFNSGRQLLKALGANAVFDMDVNEHTLTTTTQTATITHKWDSFTGALVSQQNILLYNSNDSFSMFNSSFFHPSEFELFKTWTKEKVRPLMEA